MAENLEYIGIVDTFYRHCEQSEAIQRRYEPLLDRFALLAMTKR